MRAQGGEDVGFSVNGGVGAVQLAYLRGDWAGATERWAELRRDHPVISAPYFGYMGTSGDLDTLRNHWEQFLELQALVPAWTRPPNVGVIAEALRRLREPDASAALAEEYADHADYYFTNGYVWFYGPFATALGVLSATAGDLDAAVGHLDHAVERCEHISSPSFGAIARLELANALRLRGGPGDEDRAASASAEARALMEQVGMPGWLERVDRLDAGDLEPWRMPGD